MVSAANLAATVQETRKALKNALAIPIVFFVSHIVLFIAVIVADFLLMKDHAFKHTYLYMFHLIGVGIFFATALLVTESLKPKSSGEVHIKGIFHVVTSIALIIGTAFSIWGLAWDIINPPSTRTQSLFIFLWGAAWVGLAMLSVYGYIKFATIVDTYRDAFDRASIVYTGSPSQTIQDDLFPQPQNPGPIRVVG